jgi:hypothetical protein
MRRTQGRVLSAMALALVLALSSASAFADGGGNGPVPGPVGVSTFDVVSWLVDAGSYAMNLV